ncbi:GlcG/HbpS family heme-binding protein [Pseudomonas citronellolis]|uniref:GlcG/HbpS family heme-binding protein n=1 Tax=Pseudomonas citronellolis TaxID=53408 RepID=UPI0023E35666|nr:heme-binding protein [Pseudomonas citronellolis]MDF3934781.1 heme-binding protein [Pseudomonas citronellolis]
MSAFVRQQAQITLNLATQAMQAALGRAEELGLRLSIAVVDASGLPVLTAHMDGAAQPCREIALKKAGTAAAFDKPTGAWQAYLEQSAPTVRHGLPLQTGLVLFGGGEPLRLGEVVIGAIGVSGASEAQDMLCAQAAVERVRHLLAD